MIASVSTVKDNLANIQRFVTGNLAGGIDHLFIFLDAPNPEVEAWLATRPEVSFVVTDKTWWQGTRPKLLNRRQTVNANLVRALLTRTDVEWLFHIDADEIAQIDRAALAAVPAAEKVVRLRPLEAISQLGSTEPPTTYKRLLRPAELELLCTLGLLDRPTNALYFRSHTVGKVGIRPQMDIWLRIHRAMTGRDKGVKALDVGLKVLHNESYSGVEFVRKWTNMIGSGPSINFGPERMRIADGIRSLLDSGLDQATTSRFLTEIYVRHMEDPLEELRDLGLLVEVDPQQGTHVPQVASPAQKARFDALLEAMRDQDKLAFVPAATSPRKLTKLVQSLQVD